MSSEQGPSPWFAEIADAVGQLQAAYSTYRSAEYRAVLQSRPDTGEWINVLGKITFQASPPETLERSSLEFLAEPGLHLLVLPLDPDGAVKLLKELATEGNYKAKLPDQELRIKLDPRAEEKPVTMKPEVLTAEAFLGQQGAELGALVFALTTRELAGKLGVQNESMAPLGYNNFERLLYNLVLNPTGPVPVNPYWHAGSSSGLRVVLPFYHARLGKVEIDGPKLTVDVQLGDDVPAGDFSMVVKAERFREGMDLATGQERPIRVKPLPAKRFERTFEENLRHAEADLFWEKARGAFPKQVDKKWAKRVEKSTNAQLELFGRFDPDFAILEERLEGGRAKDGQVDFEWAVAHLLSLAGFNIQWFGYLRGAMRETEIDVIGWRPEKKWLVLGECTVKGAEVDRKVVDLADKAQSIETEFESWHVKKVLFTTIGSKALQGKQADAAREKGIIVVPSEALERILKAVRAGHPIEGVWQGLRTDLVSYPDRFPA